MADIKLYTTDHGQKIRARTYYSDIGDASSIKIKFKKLGASTTAELDADVVSGDTTYYAVEASITDGFLDSMAGSWLGQAEATFNNAVLTGKPFTMKVKATPTA
jgi:hypothetical protein